MKIIILSRKKSLHSTSRLKKEAELLGHEVRVLDPLKCVLVLQKKSPRIFYSKREIKDIGVVIPRIGASITEYGLAVVNHFSMMKVPVVNHYIAISRSRDKLRALQYLTKKNIDIPKTVMMKTIDNLDRALELVGGVPCIIKLLQGTQGIGVMIAESRQAVQSVLDTLWGLNQDIIVQQCVKESIGRDIRAFVIGDHVVAAMRREAKAGEFRSNIHRGGEGVTVQLPRKYARLAVEATKMMGLRIAGVDILESKDGPKILEINSSPGFEGLEATSGINIAREVIQYSVQFALDQKRKKKRDPSPRLRGGRMA